MSIYPTVNVYDIRFGYWSQQFKKEAQNYWQEDRSCEALGTKCTLLHTASS
jgi:hypothetical protein